MLIAPGTRERVSSGRDAAAPASAASLVWVWVGSDESQETASSELLEEALNSAPLGALLRSLLPVRSCMVLPQLPGATWNGAHDPAARALRQLLLSPANAPKRLGSANMDGARLLEAVIAGCSYINAARLATPQGRLVSPAIWETERECSRALAYSSETMDHGHGMGGANDGAPAPAAIVSKPSQTSMRESCSSPACGSAMDSASQSVSILQLGPPGSIMNRLQTRLQSQHASQRGLKSPSRTSTVSAARSPGAARTRPAASSRSGSPPLHHPVVPLCSQPDSPHGPRSASLGAYRPALIANSPARLHSSNMCSHVSSSKRPPPVMAPGSPAATASPFGSRVRAVRSGRASPAPSPGSKAAAVSPSSSGLSVALESRGVSRGLRAILTRDERARDERLEAERAAAAAFEARMAAEDAKHRERLEERASREREARERLMWQQQARQAEEAAARAREEREEHRREMERREAMRREAARREIEQREVELQISARSPDMAPLALTTSGLRGAAVHDVASVLAPLHEEERLREETRQQVLLLAEEAVQAEESQDRDATMIRMSMPIGISRDISQDADEQCAYQTSHNSHESEVSLSGGNQREASRLAVEAAEGEAEKVEASSSENVLFAHTKLCELADGGLHRDVESAVDGLVSKILSSAIPTHETATMRSATLLDAHSASCEVSASGSTSERVYDGLACGTPEALKMARQMTSEEVMRRAAALSAQLLQEAHLEAEVPDLDRVGRAAGLSAESNVNGRYRRDGPDLDENVSQQSEARTVQHVAEDPQLAQRAAELHATLQPDAHRLGAHSSSQQLGACNVESPGGSTADEMSQAGRSAMVDLSSLDVHMEHAEKYITSMQATSSACAHAASYRADGVADPTHGYAPSHRFELEHQRRLALSACLYARCSQTEWCLHRSFATWRQAASSIAERSLEGQVAELVKTRTQLLATQVELRSAKAEAEAVLARSNEEARAALGKVTADMQAALDSTKADAKVAMAAAKAEAETGFHSAQVELQKSLELARSDLAKARRDAQQNETDALTRHKAAARQYALRVLFVHREREEALRVMAAVSQWKWATAAIGALLHQRCLLRHSRLVHLARACAIVNARDQRFVLRRWHATIVVATILALGRQVEDARAGIVTAKRQSGPQRLFVLWWARRADTLRHALQAWLHAVLATDEGATAMELAMLEANMLGRRSERRAS